MFSPVLATTTRLHVNFITIVLTVNFNLFPSLKLHKYMLFSWNKRRVLLCKIQKMCVVSDTDRQFQHVYYLAIRHFSTKLLLPNYFRPSLTLNKQHTSKLLNFNKSFWNSELCLEMLLMKLTNQNTIYFSRRFN